MENYQDGACIKEGTGSICKDLTHIKNHWDFICAVMAAILTLKKQKTSPLDIPGHGGQKTTQICGFGENL